MRACSETGTSVTMRGAGTSIAGNALGAGVVVATRSLARIVELEPAQGWAVVEPGVVLDDLNAAAAPFGLRVGPDPSTHNRCTVGGMIGNNACGSHSVAWGTTAQNILGLDVVRSDGSRLRLTSPEAPTRPADPDWPELGGPLAYELRALTAANEELIRRELPTLAAPRVRLRSRLAAARTWSRPRQEPRRHRGHLCGRRACHGAPGPATRLAFPARARLRR